MPAGLRNKRAARQDARPPDEAAIDHPGPGWIEGAGVPDGGEAFVQGAADEGGDAGGPLGPGLGRAAVRLGEGEVDVGVGQAGKKGAAGKIDNGRSGGGWEGIGREYASDTAFPHLQRDVMAGVSAGSIN